MNYQSFLYKRVEGNPIEPLLKRLVDHFLDKNYSTSSSVAYVAAANHFGNWLGKRPLNALMVQRYLTKHLPKCHCQGSAPCDPRWNRGALRHLLAIAGLPSFVSKGFTDDLMEKYREYLRQERGLKVSSVRESIRQARRTAACLKAGCPSDLKQWTVKRVQQHTLREVRGYVGSTANVITTRIRSCLTFLYREKYLRLDLAKAVPKVPFWRRPTLPPTLDPETVKQLVEAAAADHTPQGLRNYAIILCLSELGVRAGDLMSLELDDIDWKAGTFGLRQVKQRREMQLPLSRKLVLALQAYVKRGRPACASKCVFVHDRAPIGKPLTAAGVSNILKKLSAAADLPTLVQSSHAFRRAFATKMLNAGATPKQIADVMGHQSINTTLRYARADMKALDQVILPWPKMQEAAL
jgi:integrase/recombinase XerD